MLIHLQNRGKALDFAETKTFLAEHGGDWDASEVPILQQSQKQQCKDLPKQKLPSTVAMNAMTWTC